MINPLVKTIIVDGYYSEQQASQLANTVQDLQFTANEFGEEIKNFNLLDPNFNATASEVFNTKLEAIEDISGVFRKPELFIHFEGFDSTNEWVFAVALRPAQFNTYKHESGAENALQEYRLNYRDMMQWELSSGVFLQPGQGVLFRPWLFHSFDLGLIQIFRLVEKA